MKKIETIDYKSVKASIGVLCDDSKELATSLLNEVTFMNETLTSLKEEVQKQGVVTEMSQGSYSIKRSNPALQTYNQLIKNYTNCIKQLYELLPKEQNTDTDDDLDEFLNE